MRFFIFNQYYIWTRSVQVFSEKFGTFILKETQDIHPKMKKKDIY